MRIVKCEVFQFVCRYCVCLQTVTKMKKCKSLQHIEMLVLVWLYACAHVCVLSHCVGFGGYLLLF